MKKKIKVIFITFTIITFIGTAAILMTIGNDKIHFIHTGYSDAILIESNNKFALIDAAENNKLNNKEINLESDEGVVKYLDDLNIDKLEFCLGTHAHSDHIGGMDSIINKYKVNKLYIKKYNPKKLIDEEFKYNNQEVYDDMIKAANNKSVEIIHPSDSNNEFSLGDFKIKIVNYEETTKDKISENANSLGIEITKGRNKIFLAGDINNEDGDEDKLAKTIGKVNVLKVGHHGLKGSSSENFIKSLHPKISVVTGKKETFDKDVEKRLNSTNSKIYITGECGHVITIIYNNFTSCHSLPDVHNKLL
ncbi:MBL fold metallo-hydrolase [Romboutsia maritimum]|uniref:MBL fold metallo-hydrolase n=1 Tax=Romboutsia maritimum TaxID=2020948 RepID=A0A371IR20_9FIRM|nr:MBL fold metallo-hydrolase [Romboutsia maritimum]RDY22918.1 MBL fold metallo-hydrolase [Romboutsia maritimum]